jgi:hypothetical protein
MELVRNGKKTLENLERYNSCEKRVTMRCEVNLLTSKSTPFYFFFKVDESIKTVIYSYYLTKDNKERIEPEE